MLFGVLVDVAVVVAYGTGHQKTYGGEGGEVQKKNSRKGKFNEKKFVHAN